MKAEIIAIGSELQQGIVVDTNSAYLARQLTAHGIVLVRHSVVGDDLGAIVEAIREAMQRAEFVICTGGLGPTADDLTREAVAIALDRPLEFHQELLDQIAARFAAMKRPMSDSNHVQAYIPQGARIIPNGYGTAPSFLVEEQVSTLVVLPGVPFEMRTLMETEVMPFLHNERGISQVTIVRVLQVIGLGESIIGERIADLMQADNPDIGTSAKQGRCELRISATAETSEEAEKLLEPLIKTLHERLGEHLIGEESPIDLVARLLIERNLSLSIYEQSINAPLYHALRSNSKGMEMVRSVVIEAEPEKCSVLAFGDNEGLAMIPIDRQAFAASRWLLIETLCDVAITICIDSEVQEQGTHKVVVILEPTIELKQDVIHVSRPFDLRLPESWEFVGNFAIEVLRRYLMQDNHV